ncbi:hypothetical protein D3C87_917860 [compost metagenome]
MKIQSNFSQTVIVLQSNEELDKVFALDHDTLDEFTRYFYQTEKINELKAILSVVEFLPDVKQWLETNLGHADSGQYWVVWRTIRDIDNFQLQYKANLFFKDSKYAALFRLFWL